VELKPEPCEIVKGKQYHLWLLFLGGTQAKWPKKLSAYQAREQFKETIEQFRSQNEKAVIENIGLVTALHNLGPDDNVTAYVWVSEATP
jgi:hypothetical protein